MRINNLTGRRFGKLTVLECAGRDKRNNATWKCQCDCGQHTVVVSGNLTTGHTQSCGCDRETETRRANTRHGYAGRGERKARIYKIWAAMIARCSCQTASNFTNYGGRGISVCDEWRSFEPFADWAMSNGYRDSLSIDRIDVNGNYCPENCRWVTVLEQANNTRRNRYVDFNGHPVTIAELSRASGVPYKTLYQRLCQDKWDLDRAISEPINARCAG